MLTLKNAFKLIDYDYTKDIYYNTIWINNTCYTAKKVRENFDFNIQVKKIQAKLLAQ